MINLSDAKAGDLVITEGGHRHKIVRVDDKYVYYRIDPLVLCAVDINTGICGSHLHKPHKSDVVKLISRYHI